MIVQRTYLKASAGASGTSLQLQERVKGLGSGKMYVVVNPYGATSEIKSLTTINSEGSDILAVAALSNAHVAGEEVWLVDSSALALRGSKTFDPPLVASGAEDTTTVTVTGAALGDLAVPSFSLDLTGLIMTAYVSAANTVTVRWRNGTGGDVNLASGTLRVMVFKAW